MSPIDVVVWPVDNGGNLLASAMAVIPTERGDIKVHRIKVVRNKKGSVSSPFRKRRTPKTARTSTQNLSSYRLS